MNDELIELNKSVYFKKLDEKYIKEQRKKKNRYYSAKKRKKRKKNLSEIISTLEETGKVCDYISPKDIEERLIELYSKIIRTNKYIFNSNIKISNRRLEIIEKYREIAVSKFINLSSIIIGSLISKFNRNKIPELSVELFDSAILAILKLLKNGNYDSSKAKITSQIYEVSRWAMVQHIQKKSKDNNKTMILF